MFGLFILIGLIITVVPATAQNEPEILANQASLHFPDKIIFSLEAAGAKNVTSVKLLYGTSGRTCQSGQASQSPDFEAGEALKASWTWELQRSGALPIGTQVWWQWQLYDAEGKVASTEVQTLTVEDQRHSWRTLDSDAITVHWYAGEHSFGSEVLRIARDSLKRLETEMGVSIQDEVHIIIYPTVHEVQEALIVTADWAGGQAFPEYNSMIVAIPPESIDWAREMIPHEMAHLVTEVRIYNCRGGWMPAWLSEGLAVYAEGAIQEPMRQRVLSELADGRLPPLLALSNGFSAYGDDASLNYEQSALVVEYLLLTFGVEKMDALLTEIQEGKSTNAALQAIYGMNTSGVDAAWRASLGFGSIDESGELTVTPTRTTIPTLAIGTAMVQPRSTATPGPVASETNTPTPTRKLTPAPPAAQSQDANVPGTGISRPAWILPTMIVALLTLTGGVIVWQGRGKTKR